MAPGSKKRKAESEYSTNKSTRKNMAAREKASGEARSVLLDKGATQKYISTQWTKFKPIAIHILNAAQNEDERQFLEAELRKQSKNIALAKR